MIDDERIDKAVEEELRRRGVHEELAPAVAPGESALSSEEHKLDIARLRSKLRDKFRRELAVEEKSLPDENDSKD